MIDKKLCIVCVGAHAFDMMKGPGGCTYCHLGLHRARRVAAGDYSRRSGGSAAGRNEKGRKVGRVRPTEIFALF